MVGGRRRRDASAAEGWGGIDRGGLGSWLGQRMRRRRSCGGEVQEERGERPSQLGDETTAFPSRGRGWSRGEEEEGEGQPPAKLGARRLCWGGRCSVGWVGRWRGGRREVERSCRRR